MIDPATVKEGDRVTLDNGRMSSGVVDMVTEEGNFVRIRWNLVKRPDILSKQSPLWHVLEKRA